MKSKLTLVGLLATILTGCGNDDVLSVTEKPTDGEFRDTAVSQNVKAITNYISKHHRLISRSADELIYPYIVDGDTVMYIANYGDGWEVFSNDPRTPMVLMKCDEGDFYPTALDTESPFEDLFQNTAKYLNSLKKTDFAPNDTINSEWLAYGIEPLSYSDDDDDRETKHQYHWHYVGGKYKDYHDTYMPAGGRLITQWHYNDYFRLYTPFDTLGRHTSVGCTAVAIGQYLYYTHYKDNLPKYTVTNAKFNNNSYLFSGSSSSVWDSFVLSHQKDTTNMKSTAIFLGWVAQQINTEFGEFSEADTGGVTLSFFNNQTQLNASVKNYNRYSVEDIMKKGYPVIVRAGRTGIPGGHMWIIDYCESKGSLDEHFYVYIKHGESTEEEEELDNDFFENLSIEKIKEIYGEVDVKVEVYTHNKSFFKANWGYSTSYKNYNNVEFDANIPSWSINPDYPYNKDPKIYYF